MRRVDSNSYCWQPPIVSHVVSTRRPVPPLSCTQLHPTMHKLDCNATERSVSATDTVTVTARHTGVPLHHLQLHSLAHSLHCCSHDQPDTQIAPLFTRTHYHSIPLLSATDNRSVHLHAISELRDLTTATVNVHRLSRSRQHCSNLLLFRLSIAPRARSSTTTIPSSFRCDLPALLPCCVG